MPSVLQPRPCQLECWHGNHTQSELESRRVRTISYPPSAHLQSSCSVVANPLRINSSSLRQAVRRSPGPLNLRRMCSANGAEPTGSRVLSPLLGYRCTVPRLVRAEQSFFLPGCVERSGLLNSSAGLSWRSALRHTSPVQPDRGRRGPVVLSGLNPQMLIF